MHFSEKYQAIEKGEHFQRGVADFKEKNFKVDDNVKAKWYKKYISKEHYEKWCRGNAGYTLLNEIGKGSHKQYEVAYLAVNTHLDAEEIINPDILKRIDNDRRMKGVMPYVTDD